MRTVLEGFDELRRACSGERVRAYLVEGVTGVSLPEGKQVNTPWGILRPAPKTDPSRVYRVGPSMNATCVLVASRLIPVAFDRSAQPEHDFDLAEVSSERARMLLPLACAMASPNGGPAVPILTWSTVLIPFEYFHSYSSPLLPTVLRSTVDIGPITVAIEEWARRAEASHAPTVDVAARRLATAVGHRMDRGDALVDAVMVWENLVGADSELTFRVTAALAKLLEAEPAKRRPLRKELAEVYSVRSRIVHGNTVDAQTTNDAATRAVDVAVAALRACYARGEEWMAMTSTDRANVLLLEEP